MKIIRIENLDADFFVPIFFTDEQLQNICVIISSV